MRLTRILAIAALAGGFGVAPDAGLTQEAQLQPAETPASDFAGKQYVDSQGCVFVRAGIDGDVSWVPRVNKQRETVCGFQPTLATAAPQPVPAVVVVETSTPVVTPRPAPRVARKPKVVAATPRRVAPVPRIILASSTRPAQAVRNRDTITSETRIVPKHVYENRANTRNVAIPKGYRQVWTDGRLNPHRAEQNLTGRAQMRLIWTNTLPRRLVHAGTGRDMTDSVPLIYPYTSMTEQELALGEVNIVKRNGKVVKRVVPKAAARQPVYSTRSAPKEALDVVSFVQVGTYRNAANAQRTAQQIARMGLPARIGKHRKRGKTYMIVQAGPFADARKVSSAVKRLQQAGYSDAFVR